MPRKIVQISVTGTQKLTEFGHPEPALAFACVCEDGTTWAMDPDVRHKWYRLPEVKTDAEIQQEIEQRRDASARFHEAHADASKLPIEGCDCDTCYAATPVVETAMPDTGDGIDLMEALKVSLADTKK